MANKNTIEVTLTVDDKGSVTVKQFGEGTKKAFQDTEKSAGELSQSSSRLFDTMKNHWFVLSAAGIAAIYGITKAIGGTISAVSEWIGLAEVQEGAERRLEAVIKATGGAAGYTIGQFKEMASQMQSVTKVGDEVIISGMTILSTFRNIKGDVFKEATMAALDMVTVMQKGKVTAESLDSQMIQLGKALNDPVEGLAALSRVGVQFTDEQETMIKTLVKTGDVMGAQRIILEELKNEFGGAAVAMAQDFAGANAQAKNALGDVKEELGFVITKNQFFIDIQKAATAQFVDWGSKIKENRGYLMSLVKDGILWLVDGLITTINTIRFFHNAWLGIKLVGHTAIHAIAVALDELLGGLRLLLTPLDLIFAGLVRIGAIENNPFDKLAESLGQFRLSSEDVVNETLQDIEDTNRAYDKVIGTVESWKKKIESVPAVQSKAADEIIRTVENVSTAKVEQANETYTSIAAFLSQEGDAAEEAAEVTAAANEEACGKVEGYWKHTFENIHDSTSDTIFSMLKDLRGGFSEAIDKIKDWFLRLLAEMAAQAIARPIILPIMTTMAGMMGMPTTGLASMLGSSGSGGGLSIPGFNFSSLLSGGSSWALTTPIMAGGNALPSLNAFGAGATANMGMTSAVTGSAINWGALAGYAGIGLNAINAFSQISSGNYWGAGGTALGTGIGAWFGGPIGAAIGGGIGSFVGDLASSFFGSDEENEFTLSEHNPRWSKERVKWQSGKGIGTAYIDASEPALKNWDTAFGDEWYPKIAQAYIEGRDTIVTGFNDQVSGLLDTLPDSVKEQAESALGDIDFTWNAPGTRWKVSDASEAIQSLLEDYQAFLEGKLEDINGIIQEMYQKWWDSSDALDYIAQSYKDAGIQALTYNEIASQTQLVQTALGNASRLTGEQSVRFAAYLRSLQDAATGSTEAMAELAAMERSLSEAQEIAYQTSLKQAAGLDNLTAANEQMNEIIQALATTTGLSGEELMGLYGLYNQTKDDVSDLTDASERYNEIQKLLMDGASLTTDEFMDLYDEMQDLAKQLGVNTKEADIFADSLDAVQAQGADVINTLNEINQIQIADKTFNIIGRLVMPDIPDVADTSVAISGSTSGSIQMASGGLIDEHVVGIGLRSRRTYHIGEAGPEVVSPLGQNSQAGNIVIPITVVTPDGKTLQEQTIRLTLSELRDRSSHGEIVIHAGGIGSA